MRVAAVLLAGVALLACMDDARVAAFSSGAGLPAGASLGRSRTALPAAGAGRVCRMMLHREGSGAGEEGGGGLGAGRRSLVSGLALLPALLVPGLARADEGGEEIVAQGEMRLEVGSDKKLDKVGGKGTAVVTLRCVGKGIISETKQEVDIKDFPPPGRPGADGQSGGVPFVVRAKDLREKTDKGRLVNKELYGDDDIFVRVDIKSPQNKNILFGLGKAKYQADGSRQKSLVLLE